MCEVAKLWSDEATMKEVVGAIIFPKERWKDWYHRMVEPTDGHNVYCLIYNQRDEVVGEVSFHRFDVVQKVADFNIKVYDHYRGLGYGMEATRFMLDYYFNEFGGAVIQDEVTNLKGQEALRNFGFKEIAATSDGILFKLTRIQFNQQYSI